jgi:RHS repeat-associated protein
VTDQIYSYDAFGNRTDGTITLATSLLYRGEYFDSALGQYQLRARFYDPTNGRFSSLDSYEGLDVDPISLHKYLYADADPVSLADPSGHFAGTINEQHANLAFIGILLTLGFALMKVAPQIKVNIGRIPWPRKEPARPNSMRAQLQQGTQYNESEAIVRNDPITTAEVRAALMVLWFRAQNGSISWFPASNKENMQGLNQGVHPPISCGGLA